VTGPVAPYAQPRTSRGDSQQQERSTQGGANAYVPRVSGQGGQESAFAAYTSSDAFLDNRGSNGSFARYTPPGVLPPLPSRGSGSTRGHASGSQGGGYYAPVGTGMNARMQSTDSLQRTHIGTVATSADSPWVTNGWLTTDSRVLTTDAPDLKGRLDNALDNLAMSGAPFLGRFVVLSAAQRRSGGQGVVQARSASPTYSCCHAS
jgi:hypothetical protein